MLSHALQISPGPLNCDPDPGTVVPSDLTLVSL